MIRLSGVLPLKILFHFFFTVFFFSFNYFYFFFTQFYKCFPSKTSANCFSQYQQAAVLNFYSTSSYPPSFYPPSFFIALRADLKSSDAAFQFSPVFQNPFPFVIPICCFFYCSLFCFIKAALEYLIKYLFLRSQSLSLGVELFSFRHKD